MSKMLRFMKRMIMFWRFIFILSASHVIAYFGGLPNLAAESSWITNCKQNVQGTKIWMSAGISSQKKELSQQLNSIDLNKYCTCYHNKLVESLGVDLYGRVRQYNGTLSSAEMLKNHHEDQKAILQCVESQLSSLGSKAPKGASSEEKYAQFMKSILIPKNGIGGLKLGDSRDKVFEILGPTKTFKSLGNREIYYYGANTTEINITISGSKVQGIAVDRHFHGQTIGGGRIGDSVDKIKKSYPEKLATNISDYLVFCDGMSFYFSGGNGLNHVKLFALDFDIFKGVRSKNCY